MSDLTAIEIKAHVPAKDYDVSKQFYQDLGFTLCWDGGDLSYLHIGDHGEHGKPSILLQRYDVEEFANNLQMHMLVDDADAWWARVQDQRLVERYGVRSEPPEDRPWRIRDFILFDPSGVLWRIGHSLE